MKQICIALAFLLMMTAQQVRAAKDEPPPKSECQTLLDICAPASKNLVEKNREACVSCLDKCDKAKQACAKEKKDLKMNEKLSQAVNEKLTQANAFHLNCKNLCKDFSRE